MKNTPNIDLHMHTHFSDGTLSPREVVQLAKVNEVDCLAVTDHDTVFGLAQAKDESDRQNIRFINGVEFSATWERRTIHIVGLDFDPTACSMIEGTQENQGRRIERAEAIHNKLAKHKICVREQVNTQLHCSAVPTRPHFARALVEQGYCKDVNRAFKQYLGDGKRAFVAMQWPNLRQVCDWIVGAGGICVLAHPARYKLSNIKMRALIEGAIDSGVAAMEVATSTSTPQDRSILADLANEYNLWASRGSDFHSPDQAWASIGRSPALFDNLDPVWTHFSDPIQ